MSADLARQDQPSGCRRRLLQRLDMRFVGLSLVVLLLVQLVSVAAIRQSIDTKAQTQIAGELRTGEAVLKRLLEQNGQKLAEAARLLALDYGFRSAIASDDQPTILDALENQASRVEAAAAVYTDRQQRLVASTHPDVMQLLPLVRANLKAPGDSARAQVHLVDGKPFQLVTVPVRMPQLVGHVSMGFPLSAEVVQDLKRLSPLQMVLLVRARGELDWAAIPLDETARGLQRIPTSGAADGTNLSLMVGGELHRARLVPLAQGTSHESAAMLLRSVDEAVAPYRTLQWTLWLATLGGLLLFAFGSVQVARRVTGPLQQLSATAGRLGEGDYSAPVVASSGDEVGDLARSFEAMRQAVQTRETQIRRLAYWDTLTGLPNRIQFRDLLHERLERCRVHGEACSVLMLDLDRFKLINDVLGPSFGDQVLKRVAERLSGGLLREVDVIGRLPGDEFIFCLPATQAPAATVAAQRIRAALDEPLQLDDHTVDISGSIGIATSPDHGSDPDQLISRAEMAMYAAKEQRAGLLAYDARMDSASAHALSLLGELRTAVERDQLSVFLQPKVHLGTGQVLGAEALLRWQHPTRGWIAPAQFIPFAEQTGFIRTLTMWVIERSARHGLELASVLPGLSLAVNLSTRDLMDPDLSGKIERMARDVGFEPRQFTLEITESSIMDDPGRALQTLLRLRELGMRLSIDDFGTGYSSLAYLKSLPLDELKIDRSFVMSMRDDPADEKIVRSTIDLAHNLGLSVVAEGIENPQAYAHLQALGCDIGQGYFIAQPMPAAEFADWLRAGRAATPAPARRGPFLAETHVLPGSLAGAVSPG
jgi:diguanylate cyclase (GGDEF)-like protein